MKNKETILKIIFKLSFAEIHFTTSLVIGLMMNKDFLKSWRSNLTFFTDSIHFQNGRDT